MLPNIISESVRIWLLPPKPSHADMLTYPRGILGWRLLKRKALVAILFTNSMGMRCAARLILEGKRVHEKSGRFAFVFGAAPWRPLLRHLN
jgi:hypothetical protein